jgi:DNA modification methylase
MQPYLRKVEIGSCTLYQGDAMQILPTLKKVDAVVTDPPYGIGADKGFEGFGGFGKPIARKQYKGNWDDTRPPKELFDCIIESAKSVVIFGGNYFTDILPAGRHWFVWDKKNTMPTFSDCELAWTNIDRKSVKLLTYEYNGLIGKREKRVHPTQKPVEVMKWCITKLPKGTNTVLDPFMGSGSTGVGCVQLGRSFIGIELDEDYFNIACKRIQDAVNQPDLFISKPSPEVQEAMEI